MSKNHTVHEAEVFAFQKTLVGGAVLSCRVAKRPIAAIGRYAYRFTLSLRQDDYADNAVIDDVTSDPEVAEMIFNQLCTGNVLPCHLNDVVYDLLAAV